MSEGSGTSEEKPAHQRRLATILAIDIAGFSHASSHDDAAAARGVAELRRVAGEIAEAQGGRIFNTSGDGVMIEFPSASAGAVAAMALLHAGDRLPTLRIGLHLGEVTVLENGDLLGHGVNVAARLEQAASPGTALVSEVVRTQVRDGGGTTFHPVGRITLNKMRESIEAFVLAPPGVSVSRPPQENAWKAYWPAYAAAAGALVIALFLWLSGIIGDTGAPTAEITQPQQPLVAVLPFEDRSASRDLQYFADGVSEEIQYTLSRIEGLRVVSRTSSFSFRDSGRSLQEIAVALNATHILNGTIRREGDTMRITTELTYVATGETIWTEVFDRPVSDALSVQNEIALRVAFALRVVAPESLRQGVTIDTAAFDAYLRGRDAWRNGSGRSSTEIIASSQPTEATSLLEDAVRISPNFARAWSALASAYAQRQNWAVGEEQLALIEKAREAARRAIALDPGLGEPHVVVARFDPDATLSERLATTFKALELEPGDSDVMHLVATFGYAETGRNSEALQLAKRAYDLDPLSGLKGSRYFQFLLDARQMAAVERFVTEQSAREPLSATNWFGISGAYLADGDIPEARAALAKAQAAVALLPPEAQRTITQSESLKEFLAVFEAVAANDTAALETIRADLIAQPIHGQADALQRIINLVSLKDVDGAYAVAETLFIERGYADAPVNFEVVPTAFPFSRAMTNVLFAHELAPMRRDLRIWKIFEATGLAEYWQRSGKWPDFCMELDLPYDCAIEAAKAINAKPGG